MRSNVRKPTETSLGDALLAEASTLGLDVSDAVENGPARAVKAEKQVLRRIENAGVIRVEREHLDKHGLHGQTSGDFNGSFRIWRASV